MQFSASVSQPSQYMQIVSRHTMRQLFILSFVVLFFACNSRQQSASINIQNDKFRNSKLILSHDSGFVIKKNGLSFLLANALTDTTDSFWNQLKDSDTIGKYYKVRETNNYFYCTIDLTRKYTFETHLLIEINTIGDILKSERFFHGNYLCCWDNYYEGFKKYGDYFGIETCGTGSGYCASYLYLFKNILPQEKQNSIPQSYWSSLGAGGLSQRFSSEMKFKKDKLVLYYKIEYGELDDSSNFNIKKTKTFDIEYLLKNNKWTTNDSSKFEGLDLIL